MFSGQIAFYADNCVADERLVTEYEKLAALVSFVVGETVLKVKHFSVRIKNPLLALYRGTGYFSLAWAFRTAWGETV